MSFSPISQIDAASTWNTGIKTAGNPELGRDEFMRLFIAQLEHQDPLNPADPQDFAAQLAQFSSLEQMMNMNASIQTLAMLQASMNNSQAASFIGREVTAYGSAVSVQSGQAPSPIKFELGGEAEQVTINIYNEAGDVVRTEELEPDAQTFEWDGLDDSGNPVGEGNYTYVVTATDENDVSVPVITYTTGTVDGVVFDNGITYLEVAGQRITIADIAQIH